MATIEYRQYNRSECAVFLYTGSKWGDLSNFAAIPVMDFQTSEALYQALKFPERPDIQDKIKKAKTPKEAKQIAWAHKDLVDPRWAEGMSVAAMRLTIRYKLLQNYGRMGRVFRESGSMPIVEESHRDDFWGAIPSPGNKGVLVGRNCLGRLFMELRGQWLVAESGGFVPARPYYRGMKLFGELFG
jgi:type I restriction enzyme S subunit